MAANDTMRMGFLPVRSLAFGSIGVNYAAIGTASTDSSRMLLVQNLADATLMFSTDGVDDHFPLAANSFLLLDIASNRTANAQAFYLPQGTIMRVKHIGVAPTAGTVYVTYIVGVDR